MLLENQFGFRTKRGTGQAIAKAKNLIFNTLEKEKNVQRFILIWIKFSIRNHNILLQKMKIWV